MLEREAISRKMQDHYETVWQRGDAWSFETSAFEQSRYDYLFGVLDDRRYGRALEIGCGSGCFTRRLAGIAERVVALDIAAAAIERARANNADAGPGVIDWRVADVMKFDVAAEGAWDLVVFGETIYSLGWLYPFFDVAYLASRLYDATCAGGRFLLSNTYGQKDKDWLMQPYLTDTYRDLFRNVGFHLDKEEIFRGAKDKVEFEVLVSLFHKPHGEP